MRITLDLDDDLVAFLQEHLEIVDTGALVQQALTRMRRRLAAEDIIALGGSDPNATAAPRGRPPGFVDPDDGGSSDLPE